VLAPVAATAGLRFVGMSAIPAGSVVRAAHLVVSAADYDAAGGYSFRANVAAELSTSSEGLRAKSLYSRVKTSASVPWTASSRSWTGVKRSPDLSTVLNEALHHPAGPL
jgi:hypothetical protein